MELNPASVILILLGLIWYAFWAKSVMNGIRSLKWVPTQGIVSSVVDRSFDYDSLGLADGRKINATYTRLEFHFRYRVDGSSHETTNYCFGALMDTQVRAFEEGDRVTVHYNPRNPAEAVVLRGVPKTAWWGLLVLLPGVICLFL